MSQSVVITGCSRGLGLEFANRYAEKGYRVFAGARKPEASSGLCFAVEKYSNITPFALDVSDEDSIASAAGTISAGGEPLQLLINNAGIYGPRDAALESVATSELKRVLTTNTFGPILVTKALQRQLIAGAPSKVVNITSLMGSIEDNTSGGSWPYRVSKAALNMATRNMAHAMSQYGVTVVCMHPGWVRTDMGSDIAPLSIEEAVDNMVDTIEKLSKDDNGTFVDRIGHVQPW